MRSRGRHAPTRRRQAPTWCRVVAGTVAVATLAVGGSAAFTAAYGPSSTTYVVRSGDTATAIAARFGVTVDRLATANNLADPNLILVGQTLLIPTRGSATGATGPPLSWGWGGAPIFPSRLLAHPDRLVYLPSFRHWAPAMGVPAGLLESLAWMESGWQRHVVSSTGAVGIGQLEPSTARFISSELLHLRYTLDSTNADSNIRMSAAYLAWLLRSTRGNVTDALGGYYQGLASVRVRGPLWSTRIYVAVIANLWRQFRSG